jgi:hypothetical protein
VARVGDEAALGLERVGEAVEHPVDGVGQLVQLVGRAVHRDPLVHPLLGDALGQRGHAAQRRERLAGDDVAERDGDEQRASERERELGVDVGEGGLAEAGRKRAVHLAVDDPGADAEQHGAGGPEQERVQRGEAEPKCHT